MQKSVAQLTYGYFAVGWKIDCEQSLRLVTLSANSLSPVLPGLDRDCSRLDGKAPWVFGKKMPFVWETFSKVKTVQNCDKTAFRRELLNFFGVDIGLDSREIHPQKVYMCSACRRVLYHLNSGNLDPETSEGGKQGIKLFVWKEHSSNCYCLFVFQA